MIHLVIILCHREQALGLGILILRTDITCIFALELRQLRAVVERLVFRGVEGQHSELLFVSLYFLFEVGRIFSIFKQLDIVGEVCHVGLENYHPAGIIRHFLLYFVNLVLCFGDNVAVSARLVEQSGALLAGF